MPEKDLSILLKSIRPRLDHKDYVFCSIGKEDYKRLDVLPKSMFQENEGISIILERNEAVKYGFETKVLWSLITCEIDSDLEAIGFLAYMTDKLKAKNIPVNAVSAYHHDHLFVPKSKSQLALEILQSISKSS